VFFDRHGLVTDVVAGGLGDLADRYTASRTIGCANSRRSVVLRSASATSRSAALAASSSNNAGVAIYDDLSDRAALEQHLAVNLFGTHGMTQAFLPLLSRSRGAIVNVLSDTALAALPLVPAYSISKAAAFSLSQSLRALLAGRGVRVHAVLAGPVDTDMSRGLDAPKASPESVARAIFDGVENGEDEIFPRPRITGHRRELAKRCAKALERRYAALVEAAP
jgi:short-subunit dehydrogenase